VTDHPAPGPEDPAALQAENAHLRQEVEALKRQLRRCTSALEAALNQVKELKSHDLLTGLPQREQLDARTDAEIARWDRYRRPLGLVLLDIDHFASVNESYGREVGDELLHHVATVMRHAVRTMDMVARIGGQEFALLLPETNDMGALIVAERLRMDLESQIILPVLEPLTASFGVAALIEGENRESLHSRAWKALKFSKQQGSNSVALAAEQGDNHKLYSTSKK
jgi:diguanylate cyclase (GGDEF)-like protein